MSPALLPPHVPSSNAPTVTPVVELDEEHDDHESTIVAAKPTVITRRRSILAGTNMSAPRECLSAELRTNDSRRRARPGRTYRERVIIGHVTALLRTALENGMRVSPLVIASLALLTTLGP